jgi:hypothetical protein
LHQTWFGWEYRQAGVRISFDTAAPSPDGQCHVCFLKDQVGGKGRCLFLPQENA